MSNWPKIAFIVCACLWAVFGLGMYHAFGQANNSNTWATPGNQTVGGQVQMGVNASGLAVGPTAGTAGYPPGATNDNQFASGTTAGASTTLTARSGQYTYVCGFSVSPGSASAAITLTVTLSGLFAGGGQMVWSIGAPVTAAGTTGAPFTQTFWPCVRSNTINQGPGIAISALGTGGVNQSVQIWGYAQ